MNRPVLPLLHTTGIMKTQDLLSEIGELNLTYLMLAQRMLAADRDTALFRLGISEEVADILEEISPAQLVKLASTNVVLCRFRLDDQAMLGLVTQPHRETGLQQSQMSILLARHGVVEVE
jgi:flagellar transcriptional activator FlhD